MRKCMRVYYEKKKKKSKLDTLSGDDDAYGYSATGYIYQQLTGRQFFFYVEINTPKQSREQHYKVDVL